MVAVIGFDGVQSARPQLMNYLPQPRPVRRNEARMRHGREAPSLTHERQRFIGLYVIFGDVARDQIVLEGHVHIGHIAAFEERRRDVWPTEGTLYLRFHGRVGDRLTPLGTELGVDALKDAFSARFTGDAEILESCQQAWI